MRLGVLVLLASNIVLWGNPLYEFEPINYYEADPVDAVVRFFESNEVDWQSDSASGFLKSFLDTFEIPVESQVLVYSKTSLQVNNIRLDNPRAIYFNKDIYLGWVPGAKFLEVIVSSPKTGNNFYVVTNSTKKPELIRETHRCLNCHGGSFTRDIPSPFVRSVFPQANGQPIFRAGTRVVDQEVKFNQRFGGWYVTGITPDHLGNKVFVETDTGADFEKFLDMESIQKGPYPEKSSDVVAQLILQHQSEFHRLAAHLNLQTQTALFRQREFDKLLGRTDPLSDSTKRQIKSIGDKLLRYMFFSEEAKIPEIDLTASPFASVFDGRGPRDKRGRSLQELRMNGRMFKYPFSYMVYSDAFISLPGEALDYISQELSHILDPAKNFEDFKHLSRSDKMAIQQILRETTDLL